MKRHGHKDPVTAELREAVLERDRVCVLAWLDPKHVCRDKWGQSHRPDAVNLLTIEHVKSELRAGRRAPSDMGHLVAMCFSGNVGVPSKVQRESIREYLAALP